MSIKLFVSDIDGTLLEFGKNVTAKNIEAVQKMTAAGITVTVATGRMYRAALPIAKELGVNVPLITYNGALIKSVSGEVLHKEYVPPKIVLEIIDFFRAKNHHLQTYSEDVLRYPVQNDYAKAYEKSQKLAGVAVGWEELRKHTNEVGKLLSISDNETETKKLMAEVLENFGEYVDVTKSAPIYTEIVSKGVSKAAAVKILAEKLGVDRSEVMAIGDNDNDLPMLKAAGKSIAMGNAVESVKNYCDYITTPCENDGFAEAVYKYVLN